MVNAVGNIVNVRFLGEKALIQRCEHLSADISVDKADGIDLCGKIHRKNAHGELLVLVALHASCIHELLP